MLDLKKPERLREGDRIAAVSPSWGGAGDRELRHRYELGKAFIEKELGLRVREMPHTLAGSQFVADHPEARAKDLMDAFSDPEIKGIFSCIGGDDSIRLLPYMDFQRMRENPKIFLGYSDSTILHLFCLHAGFGSFYGPSILAEFGEYGGMYPYSADHVKKALFSAEPIGQILPAAEWTGERTEWAEENANLRKSMQRNSGYECLAGKGIVQGPLIGGCVEVLEMAKGTVIWPKLSDFEGAILFLETSEEMIAPTQLLWALRNFAAQGILQAASGLLFGKPYQGMYFEEYKGVICQVLKEWNLEQKPVLYNASFGHNQPMCTLPYGVLAELDCTHGALTILEGAVL